MGNKKKLHSVPPMATHVDDVTHALSGANGEVEAPEETSNPNAFVAGDVTVAIGEHADGRPILIVGVPVGIILSKEHAVQLAQHLKGSDIVIASPGDLL